MSGGRALEMSSPAWVDARSGSSWVEVMFIALASIRGRETREGDTDDDILLRLVSKLLFHPRTVRVRCASIRVWNPWLLAVWITIVRCGGTSGSTRWMDRCALQGIQIHSTNVVMMQSHSGSQPMQAVSEVDHFWMDRCALQAVQRHSM